MNPDAEIPHAPASPSSFSGSAPVKWPGEFDPLHPGTPTPETRWQPMGNNLMVRPRAVNPKTSGGIILPDMATRKTNSGTVMKVGPRVMQIEVGDEVFFSQHEEVSVRLHDTDEVIYVVAEPAVLMAINNNGPRVNRVPDYNGPAPTDVTSGILDDPRQPLGEDEADVPAA